MIDTPRKLTSIKIPRIDKAKGKVQEILDFLTENYAIKVNCFDTSKSKIESKIRKYEHQVTFDDISLHAWNEGISAGDSILRKIMRSPNQVVTYNPILDYFDNLKGKFAGKSQIDLLCEHLTARDFGDKTTEYYQNRLNYIIKKWCVATVACVYGRKPNDVALGFIQRDEGFGKTHLAKFFVPVELTDFYMISDKDSKIFNMSDAVTRNLLINFDELVGITPRSIDEFKKVLSANSLEVKGRGDIYVRRQQRLASVLFTSNHVAELGGFLHNSYGYRRWGTIELETINHRYSIAVDINQLWAEAITLMDGGYDYEWNRADFEAFKEYNTRYLIETPAMKLLRLYYEPASEDSSESRWMQPSEIINELVKAKRINSEYLKEISNEKMGEALKTLNFERQSRRRPDGVRYCYCIKNKV